MRVRIRLPMCPIVRQLGCPIYLSSVSLQNSLGKSKTHSWWGILVPLHFSDLLGSEWQWELRRAISPFYGTSKSLFIVIYRYVRRYVVSKLTYCTYSENSHIKWLWTNQSGFQISLEVFKIELFIESFEGDSRVFDLNSCFFKFRANCT